MSPIKLYYTTMIRCIFCIFCVTCIDVKGQDDLPLNLLIVNEHPVNVQINYLDVRDSTILVNLSANNKINDSISAGWMNINSQTHIHSGQNAYSLIKANGIAISPQITQCTHPNQTITFDLFFPEFDLSEPFDLVEAVDSEWKFMGCRLYDMFASDKCSSVYYAPHTFASKIYTYTESLMREGEFEQAIQPNLFILDFLQKNDIKAFQLEATVAYNICGCYNQLHKDSLALQYGKHVINLYKSNLWKEDLALARIYGIIADVYSRKEEFQIAVQMSQQSLRIKQTLYPEGSQDLALTLGKISSLYAQIEDYDKAIQTGLQAIVMREEVNGLDYSTNLPIALNLCMYYYIQQRYTEALELALSYYKEEVKKVDLSAYVKLCGIISHSYQNLGNTALSHNYAQIGYDLLKTYFPDSNRELLNYLDVLSLNEKIRIEEKFVKSENIDEFYLGVLQNLAKDYHESGNMENAIETQKRCITLRVEKNIHNKVKECEGRNRLLLYCLASGDSKCFDSMKDSCLIFTQSVFGKYSYEYAELLKLFYLNYYAGEQYVNAFLYLTASIDIYKYLISRDFPLLTYDDKEILWRDFEDWFDTMYLDCYRHAVYSSPQRIDSLNGLLYNTILFSKGLLLNSQVANKAYGKLAVLQQDRLNKEEIISSILSDNLFGTWEDVSHSLDSTSVAIEFIYDEITDEIISLTICPDFQSPILDFVCTAKELKELMNNNSSPSEYNNLLWTNLARHISNKDKIYISLEGFLNTVPIENYLMGSHFVLPTTSVIRVSSTRNLPQLNTVSLNNCLLIGGLNYGEEEKIGNLPNSKREVMKIGELLKQAGKEAIILTGDDGTKETLLQQIKAPVSIVHLATHAFYWKEKSSKNNYYSDVLVYKDSVSYNTDKRLCRSGIILSSSSSEEQLLTSYDIAGLNLKHIALVVLPNCKSGMGDITNDGIIGLQRAFKEAQVGTILMSLWDVDDYATSLFMVEFNKQCLDGENIYNALKKTQQYLRSYTDDNGVKLFESPYYWAGFVLLD